MTVGAESDAAEEWLYGVLSGDQQLTAAVNGVFANQAPRTTPFPFVVYQQMSASDLMVVGAYRVWSNLLYLVKVVGQTESFGDLRAAVARVDALLHRASGTAADGSIWGCLREKPIRLAEVEDGVSFRHAGGVYRLYVSG